MAPIQIEPTATAEVLLPSGPLPETLAFFVGVLGFRIEAIFPAEAPRTASLSGHGLRLRLTPDCREAGTIRLLCEDPGPVGGRRLVAPNGVAIELAPGDAPVEIPPLRAAFTLSRRGDGPAPAPGRAGMVYRDLIPGRQGGRFIASHIATPEGGPAADWVHFHKVRFQMIFCRRGWARLVYEDQGAPFLMAAGDCVLQPPLIRHRVLETSPGFEVVEVGCPALHETLADHAMTLPTGQLRPGRDFGGQGFLHHAAAGAAWSAHGDGGFERRDTGMMQATGGLADAYVLRPAASRRLAAPAHGGELLFGFVLDGAAVLERRGDHPLGEGDAFVIPAGEPWALRECSQDLELLQVVAAGEQAGACR